ncbi:MAG: transcriptional coactivator hfi1/ADA1 [Cirrosporium novae-zelandiae]|nr:MAG: transcriptional coactivator hfi1/ADA1 [Cirrosporium novae-zelandiae]
MSATDVNPAALSRNDSVSSITSAGQAARQTPTSTTKTTKISISAPRIEFEQIYSKLRSELGDSWSEYYQAVSGYLQGSLTQNEYAARIDPLVCADASTEHSHNQLISAIIFNLTRDPPDHTTAHFVSANDKPITNTKPFSGDAAEVRLKTEVKQMQPRERRRLKHLMETADKDEIDNELLEFHRTKKPKVPETNGPGSAGGLSNTNWDLEVKKRYTQSLFLETGEFPDSETLLARMQPICFEEAVAKGCTAPTASYMSIAVETFLKEVLSIFFGRTRSNPPAALGGSGIMTNRYRRQLEKEEDGWLSGKVQKDAGSGLLPVEAKEAQSRKMLDMSDVRLALEIGGSRLGHMPYIITSVISGYYDGELETEKRRAKEVEQVHKIERRGLVAALANGTATATDVDMADSLTIEQLGWDVNEQDDLNRLLDDCLALDS